MQQKMGLHAISPQTRSHQVKITFPFSGANECRKQFQFHLTAPKAQKRENVSKSPTTFALKRKEKKQNRKWSHFAVGNRKTQSWKFHAMQSVNLIARLISSSPKTHFFVFRSPIILSSSDNKRFANVWGCENHMASRSEQRENLINSFASQTSSCKLLQAVAVEIV